MRKFLGSRGDTIVEVMLAIAILGAVVGGAYATATRSLRTARQSQERAEALKLAENQLERLKVLAPDYLDPAKNIFRAGPAYCVGDVNNPGSASTFTNISGGSPTTDPDPAVGLANDNFGNYPAACKTSDDRYHVSVSYTAAQDDLFEVRVRWDRLGGDRDEVVMSYRIHKDYLSFQPAAPDRREQWA